METLIKRRGVVKSSLTRIEKFLAKTNTSGVPDVIMLKEKVEQLKKCSEDYENLHNEIAVLCNDEQVIPHKDDRDDFEERFDITRQQLIKLIVEERQLPKLDLPTFNGNFFQWVPFRDLFVSTIHDNLRLSGAQKLQYLKACLKDEAAVLLQSLQITNDNYVEGWNILNNRYQNKREIVRSHLKRFFQQSAINTESADNIRKLLDTTTECIRSLKVLQLSVEHWDTLIIYVISGKLDSETRKQWELSLKTDDLPTWEMLQNFLDQRSRALAAITTIKGSTLNQNSQYGKSKNFQPGSKATSVHHSATYTKKCNVCAGNHSVFKCETFIKLSANDRNNLVKDKQLCYNCLFKDHTIKDCKGGSCKTCGKKHHTLLHRETPPKENEQVPPVSSHFSSDSNHSSQVLLATIQVAILDKCGQRQMFRALLDNGSQISIVSERLVQRIGLTKRKIDLPITGLSAVGIGSASSIVKCNLLSDIDKKVNFELSAVVLPKITSTLPNFKCDPTDWDHIHGLQLADPTFNKPGPIDILFGADVYDDIVSGTTIKGQKGLPNAWQTVFGWVLRGKIIKFPVSEAKVHLAHSDIDFSLKRFWELEEPTQTKRHLTAEEEECEKHYEENHSRDSTGRYQVRLPFKSCLEKIGDSRPQAINRLKQLERRLTSQPERKEAYNQVLQEYLDLGHMEEVPTSEISKDVSECFYMPHHGVFKESSSTTKLRVVFDASAKSSTGFSLNDNLMVGPRLQDDILPILLRFRMHPICLIGDITKMYRQFPVNRDDADFQRIVFRKSPDLPIKDYRLLTATFGTASAPFLAVRSVQQLARDEKANYPAASEVLLRDLYVDDLMTGANSMNDAIKLQQQLLGITASGQLELRKWFSNRAGLLENLQPHLRGNSSEIPVESNASIKTLGMQWTPESDTFSYKVNLPAINTPLTKRAFLSEIAKIFDPIGFLSPIIIKPKIIFQQIWKLKCDWDDFLPPDITEQWMEFRSQLKEIEQLKIPRCILFSTTDPFQLFGFSDASENAYSAAIYARTISKHGEVKVELVTGKSKVSPVLQESVPRLELCGAVLLVKMLDSLQKLLLPNMKVSDIKCFTDSTVVLDWISSHPQRWKTFVANRVSQIQQSFPASRWLHVPGEENPADCASRGISPATLKDHPLWWHGPPWLQEKEIQFPPQPTGENKNFQEERRQATTLNNNFRTAESPLLGNPATLTPFMDQRGVVRGNGAEEFANGLAVVMAAELQPALTTITTIDDSLLCKYSSLNKLKRVTAMCQRFIYNLKVKDVDDRREGLITLQELNEALTYWIKVVQWNQFQHEIESLRKREPIPSKSHILSLRPFLDNHGVLRVGGRLRNATCTPDRKHPILLPKKNHLTNLIVQDYHLTYLHAGPQLLLASLQQRYWIPGGREIVRKSSLKCIVCHRHRATFEHQMMGDLPEARVSPSRPFTNTGIDYAGPFLLQPKIGKTRGRPVSLEKAYVSVFICMATRAIHLELVSDLTSEAFIGALKRFVSRRGKPANLYSDNGTNFVGADNELSLHISQLNNSDTLINQLTRDGMKWHFIPPKAPHFGGLWEAGVKSVKFHLKRVLGNSHLNFEQMTTLLTQVEACLNSRPLTQMSTDPSDYSVLTPGHFVIGDALTAVPEPDYHDVKESRLSKWERIQQLLQHFWRRWSSEYLSRLQNRPKWTQDKANLRIGDIVIIKEDNVPPLKWNLGRIHELHPGKDGHIRVATVKTSTGLFKRPIVKLSVLPFESQDQLSFILINQ